MPIESPKDKFVRLYPRGFSDPLYLRNERDYKVAAHNLWWQVLNKDEYSRLMNEDEFQEICTRVRRVDNRTTSMLSQFEKSAIQDAVATEASARLFAFVLYDLVYGEGEYQNRFDEFIEDLGRLHQKETSPSKWTIATIFPFLAYPKTQMFLKPKVTQAAAERRRFSLNYQPEPNWLTYSCLLRFADQLANEVSDLNPADMIDIQSYIWVTEMVETTS